MGVGAELQQMGCSYPRTSLGNLELHLDGNLESQPGYVDFLSDLINAYNGAAAELEGILFQRGSDYFSPSGFPQASVVITTSPSIFSALYHSPESADQLPGWVNTFVNLRLGVLVTLWDPSRGRLKPEEMAEVMHEFTHIALLEHCGMSPAQMHALVPKWISEGVPVGLFQQQPDCWLLDRLVDSARRGEDLPTIRGIEENGLFFFGNERPPDHIGYQYCATLVQRTGIWLVKNRVFEGTKYCGHRIARPEIPPLSAVVFAVGEAGQENIPLDRFLETFGVNPYRIEEELLQEVRCAA